jgi:hypothetical protein
MLTNGQTQYSRLQYERQRQEAEWQQTSQSTRYLDLLDTESTGFFPSPGDPHRVPLGGGPGEWPGFADQRNRLLEQRCDRVAHPHVQHRPHGLTEGFKKVCQRWRLDDDDMARLLHLEDESWLSALILSGNVPPLTGDLKDRMALVIGISIGLGDLFDDSREGELKWLNTRRSELGDLSPLSSMLGGDLSKLMDVVDLLDRARGLR